VNINICNLILNNVLQPIPHVFANLYLDDTMLDRDVRVSFSDDLEWNIRITKIKDVYYMSRGWRKVVQDLKLTCGQLLVFYKTKGDIFHLFVYNHDNLRVIVENGELPLQVPHVQHNKDIAVDVVIIDDENVNEEDDVVIINDGSHNDEEDDDLPELTIPVSNHFVTCYPQFVIHYLFINSILIIILRTYLLFHDTAFPKTMGYFCTNL
jgi:hypothetical protein